MSAFSPSAAAYEVVYPRIRPRYSVLRKAGWIDVLVRRMPAPKHDPTPHSFLLSFAVTECKAEWGPSTAIECSVRDSRRLVGHICGVSKVMVDLARSGVLGRLQNGVAASICTENGRGDWSIVHPG